MMSSPRRAREAREASSARRERACERLSKLLDHPLGRRVHGHVEVQDLAPSVIDREEAVQQPEGDGRHSEEINRGNRLAMVSEKRKPVLGGVAGPRQPARQVARHGTFRNVEAQLQQFAVDSGSAPRRILTRHAPDKLEEVGADLASAATRAQAPIEPKARAMPSNNGFGLDQDERFHPPRPATPQRDPEQAVEAAEAGSRMFALEHRDLLAQGQNLQTKIMARAEEREQVGEEREHGVFAIVGRSATAGRAPCSPSRSSPKEMRAAVCRRPRGRRGLNSNAPLIVAF